MRLDEDELMVDGGKVYRKEYTGDWNEGVEHYNWTCIATFHHFKGHNSPDAMAEHFYNSITSR